MYQNIFFHILNCACQRKNFFFFRYKPQFDTHIDVRERTRYTIQKPVFRKRGVLADFDFLTHTRKSFPSFSSLIWMMAVVGGGGGWCVIFVQAEKREKNHSKTQPSMHHLFTFMPFSFRSLEECLKFPFFHEAVLWSGRLKIPSSKAINTLFLSLWKYNGVYMYHHCAVVPGFVSISIPFSFPDYLTVMRRRVLNIRSRFLSFLQLRTWHGWRKKVSLWTH